MRTANQTAKLARMNLWARAPQCTASSDRPALCRSSACGGRFLVRFYPCFGLKVPITRLQSSIHGSKPHTQILYLPISISHASSVKLSTLPCLLFKVDIVSSQDHTWESTFQSFYSLSFSTHLIHSKFGILGKKQ